MVTLFGWGPMFDCPSPSPFVIKSDIQLQMLNVDFVRATADLDTVSKHKAPYVKDGEQLIQDSNFIRAHFERKLGKHLDQGLSNTDKAAGWALERMVEGHLADAQAVEHWLNDDNFAKGPALFFAEIPAQARENVCREVRDGIAATFHGTGFGRHSDAERLKLAEWDINAVVMQLGQKPFLFGDEPTAADASVSAMLITTATEFFDTPLSSLIRQHETLVSYMDRIKSRFFAKNEWPMPMPA